jgi:hypothetical protein
VSDDRVGARQLRTLLDAQTRLRRAAEEQARGARRQLERVAEGLCPEVVDELRKQDPDGLSAIPLERVAGLVLGAVRKRLTRLDAAEASGRSLEELLGEAQEEVERLRAEVMRLQAALGRAEERARQAETRAAVLAGIEDRPQPAAPPAAATARRETPVEPAAEPQASAPGDEGGSVGGWAVTLATPEAQLPAWMQDWLEEAARHGTRERDLVLLRILGQTGEARRKEAAEVFGRAIEVNPSAGSVGRAFRRLADVGVLDVVEARIGVRGQEHLLRLSQQGQDAYRLLFGQEPAPAQATELLGRHKSPEHTLLILATADVLEEARWRVDRFPDRVDLGEAGAYEPDLAAVGPDGETAYLEVERATQKKEDERREKWRRYYQVSGGNLYVAVADQEALETIRSEVVYWLGRRPFRLKMMAVTEARPDSLWAYVREQGV